VSESTPTGASRWRLFGVGAAALVIQIAVVSQVPPFSGSADIVPLVVMSVGLVLGSLRGAMFGFCVGLGADFLFVQPLGQYALLDLAVGYGAGRLMELRNPAGTLFVVPLGAGAAAFATLGFGVLQVLLGGGASLSLVVLRQSALAILWGALLAVPVHSAVRKVVKRTGPSSTGRGTRRRGYATGGLSPLIPGKKR